MKFEKRGVELEDIKQRGGRSHMRNRGSLYGTAQPEGPFSRQRLQGGHLPSRFDLRPRPNVLGQVVSANMLAALGSVRVVRGLERKVLEVLVFAMERVPEGARRPFPRLVPLLANHLVVHVLPGRFHLFLPLQVEFEQNGCVRRKEEAVGFSAEEVDQDWPLRAKRREGHSD